MAEAAPSVRAARVAYQTWKRRLDVYVRPDRLRQFEGEANRLYHGGAFPPEAASRLVELNLAVWARGNR